MKNKTLISKNNNRKEIMTVWGFLLMFLWVGWLFGVALTSISIVESFFLLFFITVVMTIMMFFGSMLKRKI